ncbi:MAG TPA: heavy-metal-associated domain-containing protein [Nitrososphaerales archaeon]|nr:heavy-metal-associated domain-containing protein [Nitrososphaerales archaeon]
MWKLKIIEAVSIFRVDSVDEAGDLRKVESALKRLDGVNDVEFDYLHDNVLVRYDPSKIEESALKKAAKAARRR